MSVCVLCSLPPPAHPAATPEHTKEPLEYMRKAQVQSFSISLHIHSSFLLRIPLCSLHICTTLCSRVCLCVFACGVFHRHAGRRGSWRVWTVCVLSWGFHWPARYSPHKNTHARTTALTPHGTMFNSYRTKALTCHRTITLTFYITKPLTSYRAM